MPSTLDMLTSTYSARDSVQESDGYQLGSFSSAGRSSFSSFGNAERNDSMGSNMYGGGGGGDDGFAHPPRFIPNGTFCQAADIGPHARPPHSADSI